MSCRVVIPGESAGIPAYRGDKDNGNYCGRNRHVQGSDPPLPPTTGHPAVQSAQASLAHQQNANSKGDAAYREYGKGQNKSRARNTH